MDRQNQYSLFGYSYGVISAKARFATSCDEAGRKRIALRTNKGTTAFFSVEELQDTKVVLVSGTRQITVLRKTRCS